jgi:6-pyruvoyltetrahydropterin/6-carboxytetrahydropterin synthase
MLLRREFTFDAAHRLTQYHGKCENLHGHTYKMSVDIKGYPDSEGMIIDFIRVKEIVGEEIISKFDHAYLNDILPQPSAENIARYSFEKLAPLLEGPNHSLEAIEVWETARSSVVFSRSDMEEARRER